MGNFANGFVVGIVIGLVLLGAGYAAFWAQESVVTGVTVTHNGAPVDNLRVDVYCAPRSTQADIRSQPIQSGTTDGTGSFTWNMWNWNTCNGYYGLAYTFNYNGTGLIFIGGLNGVLSVKV